MKKPLERWDYQDGQPWGYGTPVSAVSMFLSACDDIETSQEYTVEDTFKYGFAERYRLENAIAQPTTGTFSVTTTKLQAQIPIRNSPVEVAIGAMRKVGLPAQFQPSDHQSFPELLQSEVEDVISALVKYFKIPRDKIKPEHLQTFVFSHCRPFYLTHLCSGRTDTGDGLYTSRFYSQIGDKATDGVDKMNIAARWFQYRMMLSETECSLKSVGPYGIKIGNLQKESTGANEATILCLAMLGEKPEKKPLRISLHTFQMFANLLGQEDPQCLSFVRGRGSISQLMSMSQFLSTKMCLQRLLTEYWTFSQLRQGWLASNSIYE